MVISGSPSSHESKRICEGARELIEVGNCRMMNSDMSIGLFSRSRHHADALPTQPGWLHRLDTDDHVQTPIEQAGMLCTSLAREHRMSGYTFPLSPDVLLLHEPYLQPSIPAKLGSAT